jgi:hypothetical protein
MVATLVIEVCLAIYTIWRYKLTPLTRLIVLSLLALAAFQLCEYHVCTGYGDGAVRWSRAGYVAITLLPPLGLHILHVLAGKPGRKLVIFAYLTMIGFVGYFLTYHAAFIGYQCTGNYVIFQIGSHPALAYGAYYYGWLLVAILLGFRWALQVKDKMATKAKTIEALIIGYFVFLLPTAIVNSIKPETRRGIPSIMCGFAVLFALILVLYILPKAGQLRHKLDKKAK